jgi:hypothetical protein
MANIFEYVWAATARVAGRQIRLGGGFSRAMHRVSIAGTPLRPEQKVVVPANGGRVTLYDRTVHGAFEAFSLWTDADEYVNVHWMTDIPVSASDLSASGTGQRWMEQDLGNVLPFNFPTDQVRTTTTANIADWYGPTGSSGAPTLSTSANATNGLIYRIDVVNRNADTDANIWSLLVN